MNYRNTSENISRRGSNGIQRVCLRNRLLERVLLISLLPLPQRHLLRRQGVLLLPLPPRPPPPPPTPESFMPPKPTTAPAEKGATMGAVFSQINQGEGITSSLKHVDKSQMTHKNPSLREKKASPRLPEKPAGLRRNASGSSTTAVHKAGKKTLEGVKWVIVCSPVL